MKLSTKAALYSGLVFPGTGFFVLKKPWLALIFLIPAAVAIFYIMRFIMQITSTVTDKIVAGKLALDVNALTGEVAAAMSGEGASLYAIAKTVFVISWLVSIVLSYQMGKQAENAVKEMPPEVLK